jgi:hypothetical protein
MEQDADICMRRNLSHQKSVSLNTNEQLKIVAFFLSLSFPVLLMSQSYHFGLFD